MRALRCIIATYQWGLREHLEVNTYFDMLATKKCELIENHMFPSARGKENESFWGEKKTLHFQRMLAFIYQKSFYSSPLTHFWIYGLLEP